MKNEQRYKKWVNGMFEKYKSILFIEKYDLKSRPNEKSEDYYLASKFNYPYLDITIIYSEESIRDWCKDPNRAERRLVHEFCHTITDPYYCVTTDRYITKTQLEDARERLTDHISQIVYKNFNP